MGSWKYEGFTDLDLQSNVSTVLGGPISDVKLWIKYKR